MNNFLFTKDQPLVNNRINFDRLVLATTKGETGSSWAQGNLSFSLNDPDCKEILCAIAQETSSDGGNGMDIKFEASNLLFFKEKWLRIPVTNGMVSFNLPRVLRQKGKQVSNEKFVLLLKHDNKIVRISEPFLARSRLGVKPGQTKEMISKVKELRSFVPNESEILEIEKLKSEWREKGINKSKVEKATRLQYQLFNDTLPGRTLSERTRSYFKDPKTSLEIVKEVERRLTMSNTLPNQSIPDTNTTSNQPTTSSNQPITTMDTTFDPNQDITSVTPPLPLTLSQILSVGGTQMDEELLPATDDNFQFNDDIEFSELPLGDVISTEAATKKRKSDLLGDGFDLDLDIFSYGFSPKRQRSDLDQDCLFNLKDFEFDIENPQLQEFLNS